LLDLIQPEFISSDARVQSFVPRIVNRILARQKYEPELIARLMKLMLVHEAGHTAAGQILKNLADKIETGELAGDKLDELRAALSPVLQPLLQDDGDHPLKWDASLLALSWKDQSAVGAARNLALNPQENADRRIAAVNALIAAKADSVIDIVAGVLHSESEISNLKSKILLSASRLDDPRVAEVVLAGYAKLPEELQPRAVELLTQRAGWAKSLLQAVGEKKLKAHAINVNQARRLRELKDDELSKLLKDHWGEIRDGRNPDRERIVAEMKTYIRDHQGNEANGEKVYRKVCGQCHKLYGEGAEVGPDITLNGRNDYQQLLSNVFDPNLVIGAGYRSYTAVTQGGRVVNGLLVEESPQRVVLKVQGGKQEIIPRDDIEEFKVSELSLMPEQLEKQITPEEIADLFAYITLDKPPGDASAKRLAGVYDIVPRETMNPDEFAAVFQEVAPGFTSVTSGERGVGLLAEYHGRRGVVRTHPVSKDKAAIIKGKFLIPSEKKTTLVIEVSHDERGDWRLLAGGKGERLLDEMISQETCPDGWAKFEVDLSKFAGQEIEVQLWNQANNWAWEFGYWGSVKIVSE
jgi:putative heme-binding domain-containing protein